MPMSGLDPNRVPYPYTGGTFPLTPQHLVLDRHCQMAERTKVPKPKLGHAPFKIDRLHTGAAHLLQIVIPSNYRVPRVVFTQPHGVGQLTIHHFRSPHRGRNRQRHHQCVATVQDSRCLGGKHALGQIVVSR